MPAYRFYKIVVQQNVTNRRNYYSNLDSLTSAVTIREALNTQQGGYVRITSLIIILLLLLKLLSQRIDSKV